METKQRSTAWDKRRRRIYCNRWKWTCTFYVLVRTFWDSLVCIYFYLCKLFNLDPICMHVFVCVCVIQVLLQLVFPPFGVLDTVNRKNSKRITSWVYSRNCLNMDLIYHLYLRKVNVNVLYNEKIRPCIMQGKAYLENYC